MPKTNEELVKAAAIDNAIIARYLYGYFSLTAAEKELIDERAF
jgi:hypothetical protein